MQEFHFTNLTPERLLDAIESVGIYPESGLLALNSYENRVYQFIADDGKRYVVKFYRPQRWSKAQILEEHAFAQELMDIEVPVVAPLIIDGETLFDYQGGWFCLFPSVGGRQFEVDNLDQLEWVGRHMGRAHQAAASKTFKYRPTINTEDYLDAPLEQLKLWLPDGLKEAFFTIAQQVSEAAKAQYKPLSQIRLHGDCHPGNILWRDGPMFVDLDDARTGPAIQDLWMMLSGEDQERRVQMEVLLEGYEEFCSFDTRELLLIEPLRAMRMIYYMGWLAKRWEDEAFKRAFPWFNSQHYWEGQILSLKEQLGALQQPPLSLHPQW
jgi:Ser/Thr protein kinase RdoA (MazF antagonist)